MNYRQIKCQCWLLLPLLEVTCISPMLRNIIQKVLVVGTEVGASGSGTRFIQSKRVSFMDYHSVTDHILAKLETPPFPLAQVRAHALDEVPWP